MPGCRTVDSAVEKPGIAGDNRPQPVGRRWTTRRPRCRSSRCPQPVEILRPRFHRPLSWAEAPSSASLWTQFGTTPQSPGCGRKKVTESVESGRNQAANRTQDDEQKTPTAPPRRASTATSGPHSLGTGASTAASAPPQPRAATLRDHWLRAARVAAGRCPCLLGRCSPDSRRRTRVAAGSPAAGGGTGGRWGYALLEELGGSTPPARVSDPAPARPPAAVPYAKGRPGTRSPEAPSTSPYGRPQPIVSRS